MMKGKFITLEGGDGSGKGEQIRLLGEYLTSKGYKVVMAREPGGVKIAEQIRKILLDPNNKEMNALTEILLYEAARAQCTAEFVVPNLKKGNIVLADRFYDSTTAYQGYGRELGHEMADRLNMIATGGLKPDLTIILDVSPKIGLARCRKDEFDPKGDRMEQEKIDFHEKIRQGYLQIAKREPERVKVVDVEKNNIEQAHKLIKKFVDGAIDS